MLERGIDPKKVSKCFPFDFHRTGKMVSLLYLKSTVKNVLERLAKILEQECDVEELLKVQGLIAENINAVLNSFHPQSF